MTCEADYIDWLVADSRRKPAPSDEVLLSTANRPPALPKDEEGPYLRWARLPFMPLNMNIDEIYDVKKLQQNLKNSACYQEFAGLGALTREDLETLAKATQFYDSAAYKENPVVIFAPKKVEDSAKPASGLSAGAWLLIAGAAAVGLYLYAKK